MDAVNALGEPKLGKVPDAKLGFLPVFEATFLPYVGLMVGGLGAGAAALYNSIVTRSWRDAAIAVLVGGAAWFLAALIFAEVDQRDNPYLLVLFARTIGIASGMFLHRRQRPIVRGHEYLDGTTLPFLGSLLAVFFASMYVLPSSVVSFLLGLVN